MITMLLVGALGVFTWQHDGAIRSLKNDNVAIHQNCDWQTGQIQKHEKALNYLYNRQNAVHGSGASKVQTQPIGPVASWMEDLK